MCMHVCAGAAKGWKHQLPRSWATGSCETPDVGAGNRTGSSARADCTVNRGTIFSAPQFYSEK